MKINSPYDMGEKLMHPSSSFVSQSEFYFFHLWMWFSVNTKAYNTKYTDKEKTKILEQQFWIFLISCFQAQHYHPPISIFSLQQL